MLFNSIEFSLFLPIVFAVYWMIPLHKLRIQNGFILFASYFFYGWWDWRFLSLIAFSSFVDYFLGLALGKSKGLLQRRALLLISVLTNIGFLGFFKYFNFFASNFYDAFTFLGYPISDPALLNIVLPVGISFYTFQTLSYTIDVYLRKIEPTRDVIAFFAFVSFFPQLVAGPIERASNLLPQFHRQRNFRYDIAADGLRQMLWGFFKKVVIADNCAIYVNDIFSNYESFSGSTLLLGACFFAFQIYGDFSGYSDIAIGTARLFGFCLIQNFAFPYFSRDIAEFWRRWHISLSTWFRDYVYIPLGGSRGDTWMKIRNISVIFLVSGFWHGANWTFIAWGALNAIYFLPLMLLNRNRINTNVVAEGKSLPTVRESLQISLTFLITLFAWIFFRSETVTDAQQYILHLFSRDLLSVPEVFPKRVIVLIGFLLVVEWFQREKNHGMQMQVESIPIGVRWGVYYILVLIVLLFGASQHEFIYFQF
ncbi:MAG: MBOAT family protein [Candidatus Omnitrophica bacterium]|nr:MBOAT family protein [Candidatus Omnitrophota bacterium]